MRIMVETHTHTVMSTHAYSTVGELIEQAKEIGLTGLAITDHGPAMGEQSSDWGFGNMRVMPDYIKGVRLFKGVELNIMDSEGRVDLREAYLKNMQIAIASLHSVTWAPTTIANHTSAYIGAAKNKHVDIIGHCGQDSYMFDYQKALKIFKEYDVAVEFNSHSFGGRPGSEKNCAEIARLCKKYEIKAVVSSDAHCAYSVGNFEPVLKMLEEVEFPENLVMNTGLEKLEEWLSGRRR